MSNDLVAIKVKGNVYADALISDGDIVVIQKCDSVENGRLAMVWIDSEREMSLKRYYDEGAKIRLQASNPTLHPFWYDKSDVKIEGKVLIVIRNYERGDQ